MNCQVKPAQRASERALVPEPSCCYSMNELSGKNASAETLFKTLLLQHELSGKLAQELAKSLCSTDQLLNCQVPLLPFLMVNLFAVFLAFSRPNPFSRPYPVFTARPVFRGHLAKRPSATFCAIKRFPGEAACAPLLQSKMQRAVAGSWPKMCASARHRVG